MEPNRLEKLEQSQAPLGHGGRTGGHTDLWLSGHGRLPRDVVKAWSLSSVGWPWVNHFTSLGLSFLTHTMGILAVPTSQGNCEV